VEYGLGIDLAPQANQFPQIRLGDSGWESLRFNADGKCSSKPPGDRDFREQSFHRPGQGVNQHNPDHFFER